MPRAKTIVLTHEFAPFRGGAATCAQEIAAAAVRLGYEVQVWAPDYAKCGANGEFSYPVVRLRTGGSLYPRDFFRLLLALRDRGQELRESQVVLASVGAHLALMILSALRLVRVKNMASLLYGSEVLRFSGNPIWRTLARPFFRKRVTRVATISEFSRGLITRTGLLPNDLPILLAPCACSSAAARPGEGKTPRGERLRILTLARIDRRKGQLEVASALALLPNEWRGKVEYAVGGTGDRTYLAQVAASCRAAGVTLHNLGAVAPNDLPTAYADCDIFAMTSRTLARSVEGFGIAYLEAGFHRKPVLAYRSGGASEAVIDEVTGLLVPEGDLPALARAMLRLLESAELRERLGAAGREQAARYDWETSARILLDP